MSMMYNRAKVRACELIDKLNKNKTPFNEILYAVETTHGFGEKFVKKRLALLEAVDGQGH